MQTAQRIGFGALLLFGVVIGAAAKHGASAPPESQPVVYAASSEQTARIYSLEQENEFLKAENASLKAEVAKLKTVKQASYVAPKKPAPKQPAKSSQRVNKYASGSSCSGGSCSTRSYSRGFFGGRFR